MRINAYVLAGDPTWLRQSISAYYRHVDQIVVSYDASGKGWTGANLPIDTCLSLLRDLDSDRKLTFLPGLFAESESRDFVAADTRQRSAALAAASEGADWVLQIDTDEVIPSIDLLMRQLEYAARHDIPAVEWPMRVLFRNLRDGRHAEIATVSNSPHVEYPGPVAVRPGVRLVDCRRTAGRFLRPTIVGDSESLQVARPAAPMELRVAALDLRDAIWHNSWARSASAVRSKIRSWGHNAGLRSWVYYYSVWLPAPVTWRALRNLHPLHGPLWPRLRAMALPHDLAADD